MSQYYGTDRYRVTAAERQKLAELKQDIMMQLRCVLVRNFRIIIETFQLIVIVRFSFHNLEFVVDPPRNTVWVDDKLNNKFDPTLWREIDVLEVANNFEEFLYAMVDALFDSINPLCLNELYKKVSEEDVTELIEAYIKEVDPCEIYNKVKSDREKAEAENS